MRYSILMVGILSLAEIAFAQHDAARTKLVAGFGGPELIHAGVTLRAANFTLLGLNAGISPSDGTAWRAVSLEHRLYVGKRRPGRAQKIWFFRQGVTWFRDEMESDHDLTLNFTGGKDIAFGDSKNGVTIDAGVFYLPNSGNSSIILVRSWNLWPALRFQLYFSS